MENLLWPETQDDTVRFSQATGYAWAMGDAGVGYVDSFEFARAYMWARREFDAHRGPAHFPPLGECWRNWHARQEINPV